MRSPAIPAPGIDWGGCLLGQADSTAPSSGALPFIFGTVLGAFAGLLAGLLLVRLIQFAAYLTGRRIEGRPIIALSVATGALLGGYLAGSR